MKITITEYTRPWGRQRPLVIEVPDDVGLLAEKQTISCEIMPDGLVAIYSRLKEEEEEDEELVLAKNTIHPEDADSPQTKLIELVRSVAKRENG